MNRPISSGFKGEQITVIPRELLREYSDKQLTSNLYVTDIGYFPNALDHYRNRPFGCPEYILIYCINGKGKIECMDNSYNVSPNTFYIIKGHTPHIYYSDKKKPWSIYWLHFAGKNASYIHNRFMKLKNGEPISIPFQQNKSKEFDYIIDLFKMGFSEHVFEYAAMLLQSLLGSFIYYSFRSDTKSGTRNDQLVTNITNYLNERIFETIKIEELENKFNRSASTLFTHFKNKTGFSLMHFFNLLKIQKACEMIQLSDRPLKEIAYELDFQDPLYFSRVFKKYMGVSPRAYRKNL